MQWRTKTRRSNSSHSYQTVPSASFRFSFFLFPFSKTISKLKSDEVTVDLDLVIREDILNWVKEDSIQTGTTVIYTSHILDGMASWATGTPFCDFQEIKLNCFCIDIVHLSNGTIKRNCSIEELKGASLLREVEKWLRKEKSEKREVCRGLMEPRYTSTSDKFYNYWN